MMINIVLFNDESVLRIAKRAVAVFSGYEGYRTSENIIWLNGFYVKFLPKIITLNFSQTNHRFDNDIIHGLKTILYGEEVYLSDDKRRSKYYKSVESSTLFDSFFNN